MRQRRLAAALAGLALALGTAGAAAAGPSSGQATGAPEHPGCFGQEAASFGPGEMGEHASGGFGADLRPGPGRAGIGNVAQIFEVNVQDLGFILGGGDCG